MLTKILLASVAVILFSVVKADNNLGIYCSIVPVGTKFPNSDDCREYYTCKSKNMLITEICPTNQEFSKDSQSCVPAGSGSCSNIKNPCQGINRKWVPDPKVCRVWHYCVNGKAVGSGSCKVGQFLDYEKQRCDNGQCSISGDNNGGVNNVCQIMQNEKFFGDFDDCTAWHKCNGLSLKSGHCGANTIYDSQTRQCIYDDKNTCGGPSEKCTKEQENKAIPDSAICSDYFVCTAQGSGFAWKRKRCPDRQFYDENLKICKSRQAATPVSTCDRCEYSTSAWANAVDPTCETYYFCTNGVQTGEGKCAKGYFNEQLQKCVVGADVEAYAKDNGACAKPPTPEPPSPEGGSGTSGTGTSGSGTSGSGTSGSGTSGSGTSGSGTSGSGTSGSGTSGSGTSGSGTSGSGTSGSGTSGSGTSGSGTSGSGTSGSGTSGSGTSGSGTSGSGTSGSGTSGSGTSGSGTSSSGNSGSGTSGSGTSGSGTSGSGTSGSGTSGSGTSGSGTLGSGTSGSGTSGSGTSGSGTSGSGTSGSGSLGSEAPGLKTKT